MALDLKTATAAEINAASDAEITAIIIAAKKETLVSDKENEAKAVERGKLEAELKVLEEKFNTDRTAIIESYADKV